MKRSTLSLIAILLASCDAGPDPITNITNAQGGNPLIGAHAMLPFPSDFHTKADPNSRTGRVVDFAEGALPGPILPTTFDGIDGWPRTPVMLAWFEDGVDPASLPDPLALDATLADNSPIFLVREDTWERVSLIAELDAAASSSLDQALILRAHQALEPNTGYIVVIRNTLLNGDGTALSAGKAFRALRDSIPTDSNEVEAMRDNFELVNNAIAGIGLDPEEVVLAWSFHTRSREQVTRPLLSMADEMMTASLGTVVVDSDEVGSENRRIQCHVSMPNFLTEGGIIETDDDDNAISQGTIDVPFLVTVPLTVTETRTPMLFGHGFFSAKEETTWSSLMKLTNPHAIPTVSTNFLGFNEEEQLASFAIMANLNRTQEISAQQVQSQANHVGLARIIREQLAPLIVEDRGDGPFNVFDDDEVVYMGISNGGTQGFSLMAVAPNLDRGILVVPGGAVIHMLQRASPWTTLGGMISVNFDTALDLQIGTALMQLHLDPWDGVNYVDHLIEPRFEGRGPIKVVLHEAVGDAQVSNTITHWMARTAGIPVFAPNTLSPHGIEELPPTEHFGPSALYIYDEGYDPLPIDNTPPIENGAHETIRALPSYLDHVAAFYETGAITYECDGACDPN